MTGACFVVVVVFVQFEKLEAEGWAKLKRFNEEKKNHRCTVSIDDSIITFFFRLHSYVSVAAAVAVCQAVACRSGTRWRCTLFAAALPDAKPRPR